MAKSYCLTIELKSDQIENGLGYLIAFSIPDGAATPDDLPEFRDWREDVREAVLRAGDQCLHSDPYTKKLVIAELMHDLSEINSCYSIQIGFLPHVPAVQVHSTNVFDDRLEIEFSDRDGHYKISEIGLSDMQRSVVSEHGKTGLAEAARRHFPFKKSAAAPTPPKNPPPAGHHPHP